MVLGSWLRWVVNFVEFPSSQNKKRKAVSYKNHSVFKDNFFFLLRIRADSLVMSSKTSLLLWIVIKAVLCYIKDIFTLTFTLQLKKDKMQGVLLNGGHDLLKQRQTPLS